ncbi:MAG: hypothetical protein QG597_609 [Actinomycetota bacterium]|jgi:hypothetical protein|nr:hypothetical protein [Actinomycetota bacterium]
MIVSALGVAVGLAVIGTTIPAQAAQPAALTIGVAPSPNGLVMVGIPTQIAVAGTRKATLDLWDPSQRKFFRIGTATPAKALAYTFQKSGLQKIRMVPVKGKPKTFTVAVYIRFPGGGMNTTPAAYGSVIFPGSENAGTEKTVSATAAEGCVFVDIGLSVAVTIRSGPTATVVVQSTGAPPTTLTATLDNPVAQLNIPVKGDVVINLTTTNLPKTTTSRWWTCLNP